MRTYKTKGIILSRRNFSESDRILTILTKYHGKITAIAKGVRRIKSKKAAHLDQLAYSSLVLAKGRELDLILEASPIETFTEMKKSLNTSATALYGAELVNVLTGEGVEGKNIFSLFLNFLREVNKENDVVKLRVLSLAFTIKLLFALGFWSQKRFKIGVKEHQILNKFLEKNLWEAKELKIENLRQLEVILRQEIEQITEKRLKSPKILAHFLVSLN